MISTNRKHYSSLQFTESFNKKMQVSTQPMMLKYPVICDKFFCYLCCREH